MLKSKSFWLAFAYSFILTLGFLITDYNLKEAAQGLDRCGQNIANIHHAAELLDIYKKVGSF